MFVLSAQMISKCVIWKPGWKTNHLGKTQGKVERAMGLGIGRACGQVFCPVAKHEQRSLVSVQAQRVSTYEADALLLAELNVCISENAVGGLNLVAIFFGTLFVV